MVRTLFSKRWVRVPRFSVVGWLVIAVVIVAAAVAVRFVVQTAQETYRQVHSAQAQAQELVRAAQASDWESSARSAELLSYMVPQFRQTVDLAWPLQFVPGAGRYVRDADIFLSKSAIILDEYLQAATLLRGMQRQWDGSLADRQTRTALFVSGRQLGEHLQRAATAADAALATWKDSPWRRHMPFDTARAEETLAKAERQLAAGQLVLNMFGTPSERTYLLLIQNNTELRPAGGFIGNYGIVTVRQGEVANLLVRDIYTLDRPAEDNVHITPPAPLQQYFNRTQWMLRDINWSPNFPTTAQKAVTMYALEGGKESLDGVVAMTPEAVDDLFAVLGPVTVGDTQYDASNFVDALQYEVERGYQADGVREGERKRVVGEIAGVLLDRLLHLPLGEFKRFDNRFVHNFDEKNIQIFSFDSTTQDLARAYGWDGALASGNENALMVVDANLGSLKTDPAVRRFVSYRVNVNAPNEAVVKVTYRHDGTEDWKTSHYRTYTRLYVPAGSKLMHAEGAMKDDTQAPGTVDVLEESGRTVFGAFVSVNPGETKTLAVRYRLPAGVDWSRLRLEKQAGNVYTSYQVALPGATKGYAPSAGTPDSATGTINWLGTLEETTVFTTQ